MRAGELRERVRIDRFTGAADGRGGAAAGWTEVCTVSCSADDAWVRERLAASGLQAEGGSNLWIRYRTGIDAGMRAVIAAGPYAGTYNIRGVQVVKARGTARAEGLAIACEKGVAV